MLVSIFVSLTLLTTHALAAKLTDAQIAAAFPGATKLTGSSASFADAFDAQFISDGKTMLVSMEVTDGLPVGWLGIGAGTGMIGSDDVIAWPVSGKWQLLSGKPTGYVAFKDAGDKDIKLLADMSTETQVVFTRPLGDAKIAKGQTFAYARSSINPGGVAASAVPGYHDLAFAIAPVDLSAAIATSAAAETTSSEPAAKADPTSESAEPETTEKPKKTPAKAQPTATATDDGSEEGSDDSGSDDSDSESVTPSTTVSRTARHRRPTDCNGMSHGMAAATTSAGQGGPSRLAASTSDADADAPGSTKAVQPTFSVTDPVSAGQNIQASAQLLLGLIAIWALL